MIARRANVRLLAPILFLGKKLLNRLEHRRFALALLHSLLSQRLHAELRQRQRAALIGNEFANLDGSSSEIEAQKWLCI